MRITHDMRMEASSEEIAEHSIMILKELTSISFVR